MKSHYYSVERQDLAGALGAPLAVLLAFAAAMHLGACLAWLPPPRPSQNMDQTILIHQAEAASRPQDAAVLLIGDSSCLMDVDAALLQDMLPGGIEVLNLGTLSYLSLDGYALLLRRYAESNPGRLRAVVLLMHPEALRLPRSDPYYVGMLLAYLDGRDVCMAVSLRRRLACLAGLTSFRDRILSRLLPRPLPGEYGRLYGFTADLEREMTRCRGSLAAPGLYRSGPGQGNAEYRLSPQLGALGRELRRNVPDGVRVFVGITPAPQSFVLPAYADLRGGMLRAWSGVVSADAALDELPATMPDSLFASTTHLNETGMACYTRQLARALAGRL